MLYGGVFLKEYLIGVVGIVLICGIISCILPNGKNAKIIQGILKLCCLSAVISPMLYLFQDESKIIKNEIYQDFFSNSVIQTDMQFIQYYSELNVLHIEQLLSDEILEKYNVAVKVSIDWEYVSNNENVTYFDSTIKINKIYLQTQNVISNEIRSAMSEYITNNYCSEVLIE